MDRTTWWLWRGACTRSLPELGRENPQRPWYCGSSHGRVGRRQVFQSMQPPISNHTTPDRTADNPVNNAGWSSPVARQAHNLKVTGSNPVPATRSILSSSASYGGVCRIFGTPQSPKAVGSSPDDPLYLRLVRLIA